MSAVLCASDLTVRFSQGFRKPRLCALDGLSLSVEAGEIIGILGPNGSGKTTLLRALSGELVPDEGSIRILGRPAGDRALATRLGYQPEAELPFRNLDSMQWLSYLSALIGLDQATALESSRRWLERLDLLGAGQRPVGHFSTGMQKRLAIAGALLAEPEVLLLDEPTAGLDPEGTLQVMSILKERADSGCAIVMASHHLQEVEELCTRVQLIVNGKTVAQGTLNELLGTGDWNLKVRDLNDAGWEKVLAEVEAAGGTVVDRSRDRQHLYALFRELME